MRQHTTHWVSTHLRVQNVQHLRLQERHLGEIHTTAPPPVLRTLPANSDSSICAATISCSITSNATAGARAVARAPAAAAAAGGCHARAQVAAAHAVLDGPMLSRPAPGR